MADEKTTNSPNPPIRAVLAMQAAMLCWFCHFALPLVEAAGSAVAGWRVAGVSGHATLSLVTGVAPTDPLVLAGSAMTAAELLLGVLMVYGLARRRPNGYLVIALALPALAAQAAAIGIGRDLVDGLSRWVWLWPAAAGLWLVAGWQLRRSTPQDRPQDHPADDQWRR